MAMRINTNVPAIQAHRYVADNSQGLRRSLEHLSSGIKINRASDGPAALMISEQMRSQIAGLSQAIDNSETAVSMIQTTEANMGEIGVLLRNMRQLALHASNEGANDPAALEANQKEFENALQSIDLIAGQAQFGQRKLLDGSNGVAGSTSSENLEFVDATMATGDSRTNGFEVKLTQIATRPKIRGTTALTEEIVQAGERLSVIEDGKMATYYSNENDTVETAVQNFQNEINQKGIRVDIKLGDDGILDLTHREYGSGYSFQTLSSTTGVLSETNEALTIAETGQDIRGTINGESAIGKGQILAGIDGAKCIEGLRIRYRGNSKELLPPLCTVSDKLAEGEEPVDPDAQEIPEEGKSVGRVYVSQNSVRFQVGPSQDQIAGISIRNLRTDFLGQRIKNRSGYESLADVDLRNFQGAQDALKLIDSAITQIADDRGSLGAFQKNTLENNLSNLRVANENLISSESIIRDTDMAAEMATYMKNQIKTKSASAMLAQANQKSDTVRQLLT